MESQSTTYTYSPLDESRRQIRLLHLLPAKKSWNSADDGQDDYNETVMKQDEDIHCTFSLASLDDELEYEALSYVWGSINDRQTIYLHGHSFLVTKNLHHALVNLRQAKERTLWIDALCINQADMNERASQILQMGSVYAQANVVVVDLGEWENAAITFRLLEALGHDKDRHHHDAATTQEVLRLFGLEVGPQTARTLLKEFLTLPWWSRVWTMQEYALAQSVVFMGNHGVCMPGAIVDNCYWCVYNHGSCCARGGYRTNSWLYLPAGDLPDHLVHLENMLDIRKDISQRKRCDVSGLLSLRDRKCSNPSDKIYGLLAITPEAFHAMIKPEYNLKHEETFTKATLAWISSTGTLDILSCVDRNRRLSTDLPSYVPDFGLGITEADEEHFSTTNAFLMRLNTLALFRASKESGPTTSARPPLQMLTKAVFIDTVLRTVSWKDYLKWLDKLPDSGTASPEPFLSRYVMPHKALWHNIAGGLYKSAEGNYRPVEGDDYIAFQERRICEKDGVVINSKDMFGFRRIVDRVNHEREIALTTSGYLGLIPKVAKPGDHVVLMPGGKVPYVVRQLEKPYKHSSSDGDSTCTERYEFMGDCYIHGIMFGEAWDEAKLRPIVLA